MYVTDKNEEALVRIMDLQYFTQIASLFLSNSLHILFKNI